ncbi:hypothetical protein KIN20_025676 [Parelaphostrongylus tenuis]|uniref:DUF7747 domain-containing protein n=1 Tax=Parelaphostrongylus tenuis TaxID=148309 RepID=A0AAD5MVL8_PARTN|nr:hypothetical protein KIN20_025676 [Parelaphostrongylus tenuis]
MRDIQTRRASAASVRDGHDGFLDVARETARQSLVVLRSEQLIRPLHHRDYYESEGKPLNRLAAESENVVSTDEPPASQPETIAVSTRPKRTIRKSVLLSDYEVRLEDQTKKGRESRVMVMLPSAVKEEPEDEEVASRATVVEEVQEEFVDIETTPEEEELDDSVIVEERTPSIQKKAPSRRSVAAPPYIEPEVVIIEGEVDIDSIELVGDDGKGTISLADDIDVAFEEEVSGGEDDQPPMLEKNAERRRPRGRPRKHSTGSSHLHRSRTGRLIPLPRSRYIADKAISKGEAERINNYNIKLMMMLENRRTVSYEWKSTWLRAEQVEVEMISLVIIRREQGWMSGKPPRLPPLVATKACFAFYIDGSTVSSVRELSSDDLKPWTTTDPVEGEPTIKPNVRKHAVGRSTALGFHDFCGYGKRFFMWHGRRDRSLVMS